MQHLIFIFNCNGDHRDLHVLTHPFPPLRSSDLPRKRTNLVAALFGGRGDEDEDADAIAAPPATERPAPSVPAARRDKQPVMTASLDPQALPGVDIDGKSTRLNSSH